MRYAFALFVLVSGGTVRLALTEPQTGLLIGHAGQDREDRKDHEEIIPLYMPYASQFSLPTTGKKKEANDGQDAENVQST